MRSGLSCLLAGALALSVASAAPLEGYSFQPPFRAFDSEGLRTVPNWMFGGTTEVMENYIRLTPDRGVRATAGQGRRRSARGAPQSSGPRGSDRRPPAHPRRTSEAGCGPASPWTSTSGR